MKPVPLGFDKDLHSDLQYSYQQFAEQQTPKQRPFLTVNSDIIILNSAFVCSSEKTRSVPCLLMAWQCTEQACHWQCGKGSFLFLYRWNSTTYISWVSYTPINWSNIGSYNGISGQCWPTINSQLNPMEHISIKFNLKIQSFHSIKRIWNCFLHLFCLGPNVFKVK